MQIMMVMTQQRTEGTQPGLRWSLKLWPARGTAQRAQQPTPIAHLRDEAANAGEAHGPR